MLYTNGTIEATQDEIEMELAAVIAAPEKQVIREASAASVQTFIDADEKLSAQGIVTAEDVDEAWVVVTFPTDPAPPNFWAAQAEQIVDGAFGTTGKGQFVEQRTEVVDEEGNPTGEQTGEWKIRMSKGYWRTELARISSLL